MPKRVKQSTISTAPESVTQAPTEGVTLPPAPAAFRRYMRLIGKKGGTVSGARRMTNLTPKQRQAIARTAARARWNKAREEPPEG